LVSEGKINVYTVLLQIHSGNCLQKIGMLDLSLIKLLQNQQGCNFFASQYTSLANHNRAAVHGWSVSQRRHHVLHPSAVLVSSLAQLSEASLLANPVATRM